jgi:hypothetical protein
MRNIVVMIYTYHSHDTRTVTIGDKETVKPISVLDYNQSLGEVDLKDQMLLSYLIERKRVNKWYMKLSQASECFSFECHDNIQK